MNYPQLHPVKTVYEYDPAADEWDQKADVPVGTCYKEVEEMGGKLYVVGGTTSSTTTYLPLMQVYDVNTDSWDININVPYAARGASLAKYNGKIYMSGGGWGSSDPKLKTLYRFDPNPTQVCTPGDTQCSGDTPQICNAGGLWEDSDNETVCGVGKQCSSGSCVDISNYCPTNGARRCLTGSQPQICQNNRWVDLTACTADQYCDPSTTTCENYVCAINQTRCYGNNPQICRADRMGWEGSDHTTVCGARNYCLANACVLNPACEVDVNEDGPVDSNDLGMIITKWNQSPCSPPCPEDITSDDKINGFDLISTLSHWGESCNW